MLREGHVVIFDGWPCPICGERLANLLSKAQFRVMRERCGISETIRAKPTQRMKEERLTPALKGGAYAANLVSILASLPKRTCR